MTLLIGAIGGLGLFIYGMQLASDGLQLAAGHRIKGILHTLTRNRILAVLLGVVITVLIQSSSATTVMLVGLVSASLMTLGQTIGVTLGAGVGTTLTVQLIAFKVTDYALLLVGLAVILIIAGSKNKRIKYIGQIILGFGLLFYGMKVMSEAMYPLRSSVFFQDLLLRFGKEPVLAVLASTLFTGIIQSSAGTIGLLLSLSSQGLLPIEAAIPLVLGANIGTCATALLTCIGTTREAKRVAVIHIIIKILGVAIFLPFLPWLGTLVQSTTHSVTRQIANAHSFYNIMLAVLFLPFTNQLAWLVTRLLPDVSQGPKSLDQADYLDESLFEVPDFAMEQAYRQAAELGRLISEGMLTQFLLVVKQGSDEAINRICERICETEKAVDSIYAKISSYALHIGTSAISEELMQRNTQLLYTINDLEHIGDIIASVANIAQKIRTEELQLSLDSMNDLTLLFEQTLVRYDQALKAFLESDQKTATQLIKERPQILRLEKELRYNHFSRMQCGDESARRSSSLYLSLVESLSRIETHIFNIAQVVLGIV